MEKYVEERRHAKKGSRCTDRPDATEDRCEEGLNVPNSVLDGCQESFTAADEEREKASTQYFKDIGLMAMLCRHDRVLFLANMTSAGEKQHYVLALIKELFTHLLKEVIVGILYDIGCFVHRSCLKYNILPDILPRITFGLLVLHAYGHQWPCQLVYHPQKHVGFSLSDGEGCERFWSRLKKLIPSFRVPGVRFRCLSALLGLIIATLASLHSLATWLLRRWNRCEDLFREVDEGTFLASHSD